MAALTYVIQNLPSLAAGPDEITALVYKWFISVLARLLLHIFQ